MAAIYALTFAFFIYSIGDILAYYSKGIIPSAISRSIIMLTLLWTNTIPKDVFQIAQLPAFGNITVGLLITCMGNTMSLKELAAQWKTIVACCVGLAIGVPMVIFGAGAIVGQQEAIAGAPIFAGGMIAYLLMSTQAAAVGNGALVALTTITLFTQSYIGVPVSSFFLRKAAKEIVDEPGKVEAYVKATQSPVAETKKKPLALPTELGRPPIYLLKIGVVASLSYFVSMLIFPDNPNRIYYVVCLLFGIAFSELGFLDRGILDKSQSGGIINFLCIMIGMANLAKTTPDQVLAVLWPVFVILVIGAIGVTIGGLLIARFIKLEPGLAVALGLTCMYGFPSTMIISNEIAEGVGRNDEERAALLNYIRPKMLVGGFTTVTFASVLVAGFLAPYIV